MKKILLVFLLLGLTAWSQESHRKMVDGKMIYENVIVVDSTLTASDLYSNALVFFANEFIDSNSVIKLDDKDNRQIIGKGKFQMGWPDQLGLMINGHTNFTLTVACKDGRYKFTFKDLVWNGITLEQGTSRDNKATKKILKNLDAKMEPLIESLKKYMSAKKEQW